MSEPTCEPGEHQWNRPTEHVTACLICGLDADEYRLGVRADEATGEGW